MYKDVFICVNYSFIKGIDHTHIAYYQLSCKRYADLYPQKLVLSDVKASELLCSSADLSIYWHSSHERLAHLLTKVYKGLLRTIYTFSCCFCPFILGWDSNIFLFLSLLLNTSLRTLHLLTFSSGSLISRNFWDKLYFFPHKHIVMNFRIAPLKNTILTQKQIVLPFLLQLAVSETWPEHHPMSCLDTFD